MINNNVGLFFGSFNPVHTGHLDLAKCIVENSYLDELWFVVSPQNPFKQKSGLIDVKHRVKMLSISIKTYPEFKLCDVELQLPLPSYTYNTLCELDKVYPDKTFSIIMGSDNLGSLMKWRDIDEIVKKYPLIVYPRPNYPIINYPNIKQFEVVDAPVFDIDSTSIRRNIQQGEDYKYLVPKEVYTYIREHNLYR